MQEPRAPAPSAIAETPWTTIDAYPFVVRLQTRWADQDGLGHINNVRIAGLYEEARSRFIQVLVAKAEPNGQRARRVIAEVRIQYLAELFYPEDIVIGCRISNIGRSAYRMQLGLFQSDRLAGACETVMVHTDKTGSFAIPDPWRAALAGYTGQAVSEL